MPSAYAHLRFGWEVLSAIPTPYRAAAKNLTQLYNVGTQGPDPLFYYNPLVENAVDKQGHHCHAMTGKAFFEAALVRYRAAPSEGAAVPLMSVPPGSFPCPPPRIWLFVPPGWPLRP